MSLEIFPYQDEGARFCASREVCGLHDEMGVGKTATIIRAMEYAKVRRGMIIVPAMLRENWLGEYRKFSRVGLRLSKGMNIHDYVAWKRDKYDVIITSYEQATKWSKDIQDNLLIHDFVALDEAHYLKNSGTQRVKAILGPRQNSEESLSQFTDHLWHITGTPIPNDPIDIYTFLAMCKCLGSKMTQGAFTKQFFYSRRTAHGSRQSPKPDMLADLQGLIRNNSIRRTLAETGVQLPPVFLTTALVDGDTQAIIDLLKEYPGLDRQIEKALEQGGLSFLDAQHVATLRRLIGEAKAIPYGEMLLEELHGGKQKQVVYGIHREALTMLHKYLRSNKMSCVLNIGGVNDKIANNEMRAFQEQEHPRVYIANIKRGGVGVTLTASHHLDLLESDWSPGNNAQAIKRIDRIGQTKTMHARFITLARSFDEVVNKIVAAKTAAIASIEGSAMNAAPLDTMLQTA